MFQRPFCAGHNLHNTYFSPLENIIKEACAESSGEFIYFPAGSRADEDIGAVDKSQEQVESNISFVKSTESDNDQALTAEPAGSLLLR